MKIDWEKQAKSFLEGHGWEMYGNGIGSHPCFCLCEDFSDGKYVEYCKEFYDKAWSSYVAQIKVLELARKEKKVVGENE